MSKRIIASTVIEPDTLPQIGSNDSYQDMIDHLNKLYNDRPVSVILYNDDYTPFYVVIQALVVVVKLNIAAATNIMYTAHNTGKALVIKCSRTEGIEYRDGLRERGLTVEIEEDE